MNTTSPMHFSFLMMPEYTLSAFSNAIGILRMANRLSMRKLYSWSIHSLDGNPVTSSAGLKLAIDGSLDDAKFTNILMICGGYSIKKYCTKELIEGLRRISKRKIPLGGICTGTYALASAGLMDGYRCTIHWENIASFREEYPGLDISSGLFVIDRDRYTCSGGISSIDLFLHLVATIHGHQLVQQISEQFTCDRVRTENDTQRAPLKYLIGSSKPKLVDAVTLMESNLEEPLTLNEVSDYVGVSRRQLERLFKRYTQQSPIQFYYSLRLEKAHALLNETNMSVTEIATATGFNSVSHLSRQFKAKYNISPTSFRKGWHLNT